MDKIKYLKENLRGSIAPVITPFDENGNVDYEKFAELVNWQIECGSDAISCCGTSGEPSSLTVEERVKVMETAVKAIDGRVPFVPGTGSTNHAETLYLTKKAQEMGADGAMVIVPYYNKPNQDALYKHFKAVAESVPGFPLIVYNIPGRTAVNLEVKTLARIVKDCPNYIGAKESNKDFEHINRVMLHCGRDFLLFSGIELLCYPMLAIGGAGSISATANVAPREVAQMHDEFFAGNYERALEMHYELMPLNDILFADTNPAPVKAALGMMGKIHPSLRMPMDLPTQSLQDEIKKVLVDYGILDKVNS